MGNSFPELSLRFSHTFIVPLILSSQNVTCTYEPSIVSEFLPPTAGVGHMMAGGPFNNQPTDSNLAKWFNTDVFKQQLPNMPRLPMHSTKVLTLDEIERQQQVVPN